MSSRAVDGAAPIRVLQLSAFFAGHGGGIEIVAGELARRLSGSGLQVLWMAGGRRGQQPPQPTAGLVCLQARSWDPLESWSGLPFPLWSPSSVVRLWRAVRWCDVVHVHDYLYPAHLLAAAFARVIGRPCILTQHIGEIGFRSRAARGLLDAINRSLGRRMLARAAAVAFVSRSVQQYFESFTPFRRRPRLVMNGVDHSLYRPGGSIPQVPDGPAELLFVGRFVEKKGMHWLRACLDIPGAAWTFIGAGPMPPEPGTACRVLGRLAPEAIVPHFQQADLLVLPSTGEGFPLVVQEALACGTPVLVSTEVFEAFPHADERCVFHVELRRHDEAAAALRAKLESLLAQRLVLRAARAHATALAQQWRWEVCAAAYHAIYREVSGRRAARRAA